LYEKLEDKYYDFLDWLQKRFPVYEKIIYPLEKRGIPSLPFLLLALFAAGALLGYGFYAAFTHQNALTVQVLDAGGQAISGAQVRLFVDSKLIETNYTNDNGLLFVKARLGKKNELVIQKEGFLQAKRVIEGGNGEMTVYLNALTPPPAVLPEKQFDYFIASNRTALQEKYGIQYAGEVVELMEELAEIVCAEGIKTRTVFEGDDLRALVNEHAPRYLLLVGGPRIMPFYEVENPLKEMPGMALMAILDPVVPTDNDYGVLDAADYAGCRECFPDVAVGRLPDGFEEKSDSRLLIELLENTIAAHAETTEARVSTIVSEDSYGSHLREGVFAEMNNELWESPPEFAWDYVKGVEGDFEGLMKFVSEPPLLFLSLHGNAPPQNQLYTSSGESGSYLVFSTALPLSGKYNARIIVSDACYGANIYRKESDSIPLHFLENGAVAFVGATTSALANKRVSRLDLIEEEILNLGCATALTYRVWQGVKNGERIGDAFLEAKQLMDAFNPADQLTALQFVLYGDPTLTVLNK